MLAVQITGELKRRQTFSGVGHHDNGGNQIHVGHLAAGEDRPGRSRELVSTCAALVLAAALDVVGVERTALRADRLSIGVGPAHLLEQFPRLLLAARVDLAEADGARPSAEEEVLGHNTGQLKWLTSHVMADMGDVN